MKLLIFFLLSLFAFVSSLPLTVRDVYVPPILSPKEAEVWVIGQTRTVTWNITEPPSQISNPQGEIYLRKGDITLLENPLAANFSILLGSKKVKVPSVEPGHYRVVLFGDSGNWSPPFRIISRRQ
ncbi:hypothetical protein AX15_002809 [Amanita polypyramis BW_CC]|nr:hypothetical protein AX15_002809 [Amanita polypyramis BW_CC]